MPCSQALEYLGRLNMRQIRIAALASPALLAGLAQSASGADMQVPYRQPAPPPGPVFTWTGLYFGGHGGCAHDRKNYTPGAFRSDDLGSTLPLDPAHGCGCDGVVLVGYHYT